MNLLFGLIVQSFLRFILIEKAAIDESPPQMEILLTNFNICRSIYVRQEKKTYSWEWP